MAKYPGGKFSDEANQSIERLDNDLYNEANSGATLESYWKYLSQSPSGKYRDEITRKYNVLYEPYIWEKAKKNQSTYSYYQYLDAFPRGSHATEVKQQIDAWDESAANKAIKNGNKDALDFYMINYPRGSYRYKIQNLLDVKKEEEFYLNARNKNTISALEAYLSQYPHGKFSASAKNLLEEDYISAGNKYFQSKEWDTAKGMYQKYIKNYPDGANVSYAQKKIKKCDGHIKRVNNGYAVKRFFSDIFPYVAGLAAGAAVWVLGHMLTGGS